MTTTNSQNARAIIDMLEALSPASRAMMHMCYSVEIRTAKILAAGFSTVSPAGLLRLALACESERYSSL